MQIRADGAQIDTFLKHDVKKKRRRRLFYANK